VHYKDQSVKPVNSIWYWLCESHATHVHTVETLHKPILVAVLSKGWVCGRSLAGIVGSNPPGGHGCLSRVGVVCYQVEVSVMCRSLVQRGPTACGVSVIVKPR